MQAGVAPARVTSAVVHCMELHASENDVITEGITALCALSRRDSYRHVVMANGGADACVSALSTFPANDLLCAKALSVLAELCQAGAGQRRRLVETGILMALAAPLTTHARVEAVVSQCVAIMHHLAGKGANSDLC